MVNQITRKVIDLIEGRDIQTVSNWLKKFKNLKIITRDGSATYRSAINKANPDIIQVGDRFHEEKALSELLIKYIRKNYSKNIIVVQSEDKKIIENNNFAQEYELLSPKSKENYDRKNIEFKQIKEYYNKCNNYSKTARKFNVGPRTVKEYVHMDYLPIRKRIITSGLNKYKDIIIDNIDKKQSDIYQIIQKKGYKGSFSNLRMYIYNNHLKISTIDKNKYVNRTNIINILLHKGISDLGLYKEEEKNLKKLLKQDEKLNKIIEINDMFSIALFSGKIGKIDKWIIDATKININELNTFIETLETDIIATKNSITHLEISNGLIEGKNCKLKALKRMMYGRCSPRLLRAKLLQLG